MPACLAPRPWLPHPLAALTHGCPANRPQVLGGVFSLDDLTGFEITKLVELPAPWGIVSRAAACRSGQPWLRWRRRCGR